MIQTTQVRRSAVIVTGQFWPCCFLTQTPHLGDHRGFLRSTVEQTDVALTHIQTNALQMASRGPFLALNLSPPCTPHHHASVIGSSCVNKVSYTTPSDCKETCDIKISSQFGHVSPVYATEEWWHRPGALKSLQRGPCGHPTKNDIIAARKHDPISLLQDLSFIVYLLYVTVLL